MFRAEPTVPMTAPLLSMNGLMDIKEGKFAEDRAGFSNTDGLPRSVVITSLSRKLAKVYHCGFFGCAARSRSAKNRPVLPMGSFESVALRNALLAWFEKM